MPEEQRLVIGLPTTCSAQIAPPGQSYLSAVTVATLLSMLSIFLL
jgi:hypothetical protein